MTSPRIGTLAFLFADIEGSTRLEEAYPSAMRAALGRHEDLVREVTEQHRGHVYDAVGDGVFASFGAVSDATAAAVAAQMRIANADWGEVGPVRVRMAVHVGDVEIVAEGHYRGLPLNRCNRLLETANGGQIVLSRAAHDMVANALPVGCALKDLGVHPLRDLSQPEHIYQLIHPDIVVDTRPLRTTDVLATNLPRQLKTFVGRSRELAEIPRLLTEHRLITLVGTGGCGKTRLAQEVAATELDRFPDGIWMVRLEDVRESEAVALAFASALVVPEPKDNTIVDAVTGHLGDHTVLLLIDNCEHVVDAAGSVIEQVLLRCPNVRVVATSRHVLNLPGERLVEVIPLPVPHSDAPRDDVAGNDAVRLFVDRARLVSPDFDVTERNAPTVARVCSALDGIPLAIELVASRAQAVSIDEMARRLLDPLSFVVGTSKSTPERHRRLEGVFDWSYDLLTPIEQTGFVRLTVFAGGFSLTAAEDVVSDNLIPHVDVIDVVQSLVMKSMISVEHDVDGGIRYRVMETLREYGRRKLAAQGEDRVVAHRHADWCLQLATEADAQLAGPDQLPWRATLEREHDNLTAALRWTWDAGETSLGLRIAFALWRFWYFAGHFGEGRMWLERLLTKTDAADMSVERANALHAAGTLASRQVDLGAARAMLSQCLEIRRTLGDSEAVARTVNNLGIVAFEQGDMDAARRLYEESLALKHTSANSASVCTTLVNLAQVAVQLGDFSAAESYAREAMDLATSLSDVRAVAVAGIPLALSAQARGDYRASEQILQETADAFVLLGDRGGTIETLLALGSVAHQSGDARRARRLCEQLLPDVQAMGDKRLMAEALGLLAESSAADGDPDTARMRAEEGVAVARSTDNPRLIADQLDSLAWVALFRADLDTARAALLDAGSLRKFGASSPRMLDTIEALMCLATALGWHAEAVRISAAVDAYRDRVHRHRSPIMVAYVEPCVNAALTALGRDAAAAEADAGTRLDLEQALELGLRCARKEE
jgi:predicted ATPase/class 3 adenylate cyclase